MGRGPRAAAPGAQAAAGRSYSCVHTCGKMLQCRGAGAPRARLRCAFWSLLCSLYLMCMPAPAPARGAVAYGGLTPGAQHQGNFFPNSSGNFGGNPLPAADRGGAHLPSGLIELIRVGLDPACHLRILKGAEGRFELALLDQRHVGPEGGQVEQRHALPVRREHGGDHPGLVKPNLAAGELHGAPGGGGAQDGAHREVAQRRLRQGEWEGRGEEDGEGHAPRRGGARGVWRGRRCPSPAPALPPPKREHLKKNTRGGVAAATSPRASPSAGPCLASGLPGSTR
eukprot:scaffold7567_cov104-Isochrysis_galbana.AAC.4